MEATSTLTRSLSLSPRARAARFPSPNHCPFSSSAPAAPLRHARSDFAAIFLPLSPLLQFLEAPDEAREEGCSDLLDGAGASRNSGGGGPGSRGGSDGGSGCAMGEYYRRVLRVDPENPLLLRNYGAYLHEVERDLAGAEACCARALMACRGDGDLLNLYGRIVWEARQEKERAEGYFEHAVQAAPDDWY